MNASGAPDEEVVLHHNGFGAAAHCQGSRRCSDAKVRGRLPVWLNDVGQGSPSSGIFSLLQCSVQVFSEGGKGSAYVP